MSIIIDLVLVGILALCVWNGYRKGLILGIAGLLVLVVAFVGANVIARTYSSEFTPIVQPFISGFVDKAVTDTSSSEGTGTEYEGNSDAAYIKSIESLNKLGILGKAAASLAESVGDSVSNLGKNIRGAITEKLSEAICFLLVFVIAFLLIVIVFTIIANIINLVFRLPGLEFINNIGGMLMGFIKGLVFVFAISWVAQYLGFLFKDDTLEKTVLLKWLMNINPVSAILKI